MLNMKYYDPDLYTRQAGRWEHLIAFGNFACGRGCFADQLSRHVCRLILTKTKNILRRRNFWCIVIHDYVVCKHYIIEETEIDRKGDFF